MAIYFWYLKDTSPAFRYTFMFYPPFNFAKIFADIGQLSTPKFDPLSGETTAAQGYSLEQLFKPVHVSIHDINSPPVYESLLYLIMNGFIFMVVAVYFDEIVPAPRRPPWFFLQPSYWGISFGKQKITEVSQEEAENMSTDALEEMKRTIEQNDQTDSLRIVNITKIYNESLWRKLTCRKAISLRALSNMYLTVEREQCLCLLGHNGAGKTTLMNILTGLVKPSNGDAYIFGMSVRRNMNKVRSVLGVCPQHDILFNELSPYQHLQLFAELKNADLSGIDDALRQVELYDRRFDRCGGFSGGMKRRLSLAISCIGNPQILFLDEPTTGLDPLSKRKVWDLIRIMKQDRVLILTTHSMTECDYLSDRIAIMASGRICCLGDSLNLKNRFGPGYRITLVISESRFVDSVMDLMRQVMGDDLLLDAQNSNSIKYTILNHVRVPELIEQIENGAIAGIKDFSLSHATLEDVFLQITKSAKEEL
jgi:ABC-type multidrug transport system ATPase subunit